MALGRVYYFGDQIRFLSKYFLKQNQRLIHGAEILETYLRGDTEFVHEVQTKKKEPDFFTFRVICDSIKEMFPDHFDSIIEDLFKMIVFDCLIGSQDRHFYNWGVIQTIGENEPPEFSPIFDTARGLLWNSTESKLLEMSTNKANLIAWIESYTRKSKPCMGY
jgi:hypothetical protein